MSSYHDYSKPKNGETFQVIDFGRVSTDNQNEKSLGDQHQYDMDHLKRLMPQAQFEITTISGRGSGQYLDREEFLELSELVATGRYDIVIAEDLARILRRMHAFIFCEAAEDVGTRVIAINDFLDTSEENWRQIAFFAVYKHSSFCSETSRRIRRSLRNRFMQGEIVQEFQYGYIKPHPKATDDQCYKDPEAEPIYETWISMLESGASYSEVARYLNEMRVSVAPPNRKKRKGRREKWDGAMVRRLTHNPLLKGERRRNTKITDRKNKTGRPKSINAPPEELLIRKVPHLAFVEEERYDRLIRQLSERNKKYQRSEERKNDPRADIPKRQTRWPGQHIRCGVCGRPFFHGGHGKTGRMMCSGARDYVCWNAMTVDAVQVADAVAGELLELVHGLPSFDEKWAAEYESQRSQLQVSQNAKLIGLEKDLADEQRALEHFVEALRNLGSSSAILEGIKSCETRIGLLQDDIHRLENTSSQHRTLPSLEEISAVADESFKNLAVECQEFGRLMKSVITEFFVLPYQLADGGHIQPRITFCVCLSALVEQTDLELLQFDRIVDLAKKPKRLIFLNDIVRLVNAGHKHNDVGEQLGIFKTEVSNGMRLHRRMKELGVTDPWVPVTRVDEAKRSFKRVRNKLFKFEPLEGFEVTRHPEND